MGDDQWTTPGELYDEAIEPAPPRPTYPPDLLTDPAMLDEVFEVQSQRAFALMRQCGVPLPTRDPEARRKRRVTK